jgi:hypothetical protein
MRLRLTTTILLSIAALVFFIMPPVPAGAISVEIGPIELKLKPGESYTGSISAFNDDVESISLKIYLGDWRQTEDGEQYLDVGKEANSLSSWMRVSPNILTIPPGGSEEIYYEIKVPDDPSLSGSYWGIFFIEGEPNSTAAREPGGSVPSLGLNIVLRHGVKVYVTIPGTEDAMAKFVAARTETLEGGGLDVVATFENQGNTYLRPDVWLELRDITGTTVYSEGHRTLSVLPGIKRDYRFELRDIGLEPGRYIALVIADYGALRLIAAQAELEVKGT